MSENWVVQNLENTLNLWNDKLYEIWDIVTQSPTEFRGGAIWSVITGIHDGLQADDLAFLTPKYLKKSAKLQYFLDKRLKF